MRLSACIEVLFKNEFPQFPDRIHAAARAGLPNVEFWHWRNKDIDAVDRAVKDTGVCVSSFLVEPTGHLVDETTHDSFIAGLRETIPVAKRLGVDNLIVVSGDALGDRSREQQHDALVAALRRAAPIAEDAGVHLILEPLNTRIDHPGNFLETTQEGFAILDEVDSPSVRLLYDMYHSTVMGEDPAVELAGRIHQVRHVHVADAPGRNEPGSGGIDWSRYMRILDELGYEGAIGLEYLPSGATDDTIERARTALNA